MSGQLQRVAEIVKLARLLGVDATELDSLDDVPAAEVRALRERVTDSLFDTGGRALQRVGAGARLLPSPLVATIAQRAFGPLLCARAAATVDPAKAIEVARRLPPTFLAETAIELDPRRVADIIAGVPTSLIEPVAAELGRRGESVTMGRFLGFVSDEAIVAAMGVLSDEVMLQTAFVLEHKQALDHAVGLLPPERLPSVLGCASRLGLWAEALDLVENLSDERRGSIADVVANLDEDLVEGLVAAVSAAGIWESLLPVVGAMSADGRLTLASRGPFHQPEVLREILAAAATGDQWVELVPLLGALPSEVAAQIPGLVAGLDHEVLASMLAQAVDHADALVPLLDIVADMDDLGRARIVAVIDNADQPLGELVVAALTDPAHIRRLLEHLPADVLGAVERAADRLGLRAEYDAALEAAGA